MARIFHFLLFCTLLAGMASRTGRAETVQEYVAGIKRIVHEAHNAGIAPSVSSESGQPLAIVLDTERLVRIGNTLVRTATNKEISEIGDALSMFIPEYLTPVNMPDVLRPLDFIAFWETTTVFQEVLSHRSWIEKARLDDVELQAMAFKHLCRWPALQDFHISMLNGDIEGKRFKGEAMEKAIASKGRLEARRNWYAGAQAQQNCHNVNAITIAPLNVQPVDSVTLAAYKLRVAAEDKKEEERNKAMQPIIDAIKAIKAKQNVDSEQK